MYMNIYIYTYMEREGDREISGDKKRERERDVQRLSFTNDFFDSGR